MTGDEARTYCWEMDLVQEWFSRHQTPFAEHIYIIKAHRVFAFLVAYSLNKYSVICPAAMGTPYKSLE